jgi:DNA polymerase I-like protein with 3'-5' exonuclease and polymerase domains
MPDVPDFDQTTLNWIDTPAQLSEFIAECRKPGTLVVLDGETTGLDPWARNARVAMFAFTLVRLDRKLQATEPVNYVLGLSHPDAPFCSTWRPVLAKVARGLRGVKLANQNLPFDLRWIGAHTGVDLSEGIVWDTGLASHLLDENQTASLKPRAAATFGIERWDDFDFNAVEIEQRREAKKRGIPEWALERKMAERVPYYQLGVYAARDTYWTWRLMERQLILFGREAEARAELIEIGQREEIQMLTLGDYQHAVMIPALRVITRMEQRGFALDTEWCEGKAANLSDEALQAFMSLEARRDEALDVVPKTADLEDVLAGEASYEPTSGYFAAWAELMRRAKELKVGAMTSTGKPSWTKEVLARQASAGSAAASDLLTYRQATKQSQFLRSWAEQVKTDGAIHSTYNYYRTVTGRLSSSEPNLQQVTKDLRPAFVARPGFVLVDADYSQIELRCAAHVANCEPMIEAFVNGEDLHTKMAASIAGVSLELVTAIMRQAAKAANFGFLYGMQAAKFVRYAQDTYGVTVTDEEAEAIRATFFDTWDGLAQWHAESEALVARRGYVTSPLGRVRRLPLAFSDDDYQRGEAVRQAINSPVQSFASDLMLLAVTEIDRHPDIYPLALVHDAVVCEVPARRAEELALVVKHRMESVGLQTAKLGCNLRVPLVADVALSRQWGRGKKLEAS